MKNDIATVSALKIDFIWDSQNGYLEYDFLTQNILMSLLYIP